MNLGRLRESVLASNIPDETKALYPASSLAF